jgi:hypothetical protein
VRIVTAPSLDVSKSVICSIRLLNAEPLFIDEGSSPSVMSTRGETALRNLGNSGLGIKERD